MHIQENEIFSWISVTGRRIFRPDSVCVLGTRQYPKREEQILIKVKNNKD